MNGNIRRWKNLCASNPHCVLVGWANRLNLDERIKRVI